MDDEYEDFEAIRAELTPRQIKLLRHYKGAPRPHDAETTDDGALRERDLIEPGEGMPHEEQFSGGRRVSTHGARPEATDKGSDWLEWYEGQV